MPCPLRSRRRSGSSGRGKKCCRAACPSPSGRWGPDRRCEAPVHTWSEHRLERARRRRYHSALHRRERGAKGTSVLANTMAEGLAVSAEARRAEGPAAVLPFGGRQAQPSCRQHQTRNLGEQPVAQSPRTATIRPATYILQPVLRRARMPDGMVMAFSEGMGCSRSCGRARLRLPLPWKPLLLALLPLGRLAHPPLGALWLRGAVVAVAALAVPPAHHSVASSAQPNAAS